MEVIMWLNFGRPYRGWGRGMRWMNRGFYRPWRRGYRRGPGCCLFFALPLLLLPFLVLAAFAAARIF